MAFVYLILSVLWAIAIGVNYLRRQNKTVIPFIVMEFLVAIASPFLFFGSCIIMATVIDFITLGQLDARMLLPHFLHSVKFKTGDKYEFWAIEDILYLQLTKRMDQDKHGFCSSCYPNFSTWLIVGIVCFPIYLVVSYLADVTLDMQVSVDSCDDDRIDLTFSCFNANNLAFVDCVDNTNIELIHCFKFYRFGVDTNLIQALSTTHLFYVAVSSTFSLTFTSIIHVMQGKTWGAVVITTGALLFMLSIAVTIVWARGYISPAQPELARLNIINLWQFIMVSLYVVLIGLLMVSGKWTEKKKTKVALPTSHRVRILIEV